ncbi:hypothetical protein D7X25_18865, partial [bacterium 1XD42-8]
PSSSSSESSSRRSYSWSRPTSNQNRSDSSGSTIKPANVLKIKNKKTQVNINGVSAGGVKIQPFVPLTQSAAIETASKYLAGMGTQISLNNPTEIVGLDSSQRITVDTTVNPITAKAHDLPLPKNISIISPSVLQIMDEQLTQAGVDDVILSSTSEQDDGNPVEIAFSLGEAVQADTSIDVSLKPDGPEVENTFDEYFENDLDVIPLSQDSFGVPVSISTQVDLSNPDSGDVRLYSYDQDTNGYEELPEIPISIDQIGNLSFITQKGNYIIVSDGELERK